MPFFVCVCVRERTQKENSKWQSARRLSPDTKSARNFILDCSACKTPRNAFLFFMGYQSPTVCYSSLNGLRHTCTDVQKDTQDCGKCLGEKYNRAK